jgi:hypothetical protein
VRFRRFAIKRQWADSVPGRRFGGCPFSFYAPTFGDLRAFWELPRVQASLRSPCRRACQNRLDQSAHRRTQASKHLPPFALLISIAEWCASRFRRPQDPSIISKSRGPNARSFARTTATPTLRCTRLRDPHHVARVDGIVKTLTVQIPKIVDNQDVGR